MSSLTQHALRLLGASVLTCLAVTAAAAAAVAQGFRGRGGSTTQRLDGAIYAASNAALMLAQLGEEEGALKEVCRAGEGCKTGLDVTGRSPAPKLC